jgi:hypothetical protein
LDFRDAPGSNSTHSRVGGVSLSNYPYAYFVGMPIFQVAWILCSIFGENCRAEIRWGAPIVTPMALAGILFVP